METYIEKNIELLYNVLSFIIDDHPEIDNKFKIMVGLLSMRNKTIVKQNKNLLHNVLVKIHSLQKKQNKLSDTIFYNEIYKEVISNI